jgi:hypothetical protein
MNDTTKVNWGSNHNGTTAIHDMVKILLSLLAFSGGLCCNHGSTDGTIRPRKLREFQFARTSERIERGRYLVTLAQCFDCHSPIDSTLLLPLPGKEGSGDIIDSAGSMPIVAPNITPDLKTGAGGWTDDMFVRAIREGFGHDGRPLESSMFSEYYSAFTDEDVASIVVYLRTLPPVRHELPRVILTDEQLGVRDEILEDSASVHTRSQKMARGAYLVRIALCEHCHSPIDSAGRRKPGLRFAGGTVGIRDSLHPVVSKNLTRDPSGISYFDEALFIQTIRTGRVGGVRELNPWMPWPYLRVMTDDDLSAIFQYLRIQQPVRHHVDNAEAPSLCRLCGTIHGLGDLN